MKDLCDSASGVDLLQRTLATARRDQAIVPVPAHEIAGPLDGMKIRDVVLHSDERGTVFEIFDPRWGWDREPMIFAYCFTVRPGIVKGWGLHKEHEDRYVLLQGELELVVYDVRPDSKTRGELSKIRLSEQKRQLVNIPRFVWHADYNIGAKDALVVNFPTAPYNHANPDKYRLPVNTDLIPHSFGDAKGW
jgi:dTDP-4-dehydrorhamnose 3,5-epimerase